MPAIDQCEPQVIRAFEKDGWVIKEQPYTIPLNDTVIFADLLIENVDDEQILMVVEVKCFPVRRNILEEFYKAIGQYLMYQSALSRLDLDFGLTLTIPHHIYEQFLLREQSALDTLNNATIKVAIIDLDDEVIVSWIN